MKKYTNIKRNKNESTNIFVMVIFRAFDFLVSVLKNTIVIN